MIDEEKEEIWKTFPEYPFVEVSNLGNIRTKDHYVPNGKGKRLVKGHILKQYLTPNGYMYVQPSVNGKQVHLRVNRAVAICFVPNPNNLPQVNHIDCDRTNNRLDNLEWCTCQENIAYRDRLGHTAKYNAPKKPVIAVNLDTSEVFWFESQREAVRQLKVNRGHINSVLKGRLNKTHDYWFCYADDTAVEKVRAKFGDEIAEKVEELIRENCN